MTSLITLKHANTAPQRGISDGHPIHDNVRRGHGDGSRRVFRQFAWLEAGSVKMALSVAPISPHQGATQTQAVGRTEGESMSRRSFFLICATDVKNSSGLPRRPRAVICK